MTLIEESDKFNMLWIVLVTGLFAYMLFTVGNYQFFEKPEAYRTAPCSTFESLPIDQIPARCVTPEGGFKS